MNYIGFVTRYYRTKSGFGVGSRIPLGPCVRLPSGGCEHIGTGSCSTPGGRTALCNCWIKVGLGARSLPTTGTFLKPWFFIFTNRGRATEFFFSRSYID